MKPLRNTYSTFLEIGSGDGTVSSALLSLGFTGKAIDLNTAACEENEKINASHIAKGKYHVYTEDFMNIASEKVDFIISCMVIEHIEDAPLKLFIAKCKEMLNPKGRIIFLVPSSMKYWGIEDEIAGHIKRYEYLTMKLLAKENSLKVEHIAGLTYPLSNWMFKLSNRLVKKKESDKLKLSQKDRTIYTGYRDVKYKTTFPKVFNIILNPLVLLPFYFLQNLNLSNPSAMVIYCELSN